MSFLIRDARESDLPRLLELERACFSVPWTEDMLRRQMAPGQNVFLAAETEGSLI